MNFAQRIVFRAPSGTLARIRAVLREGETLAAALRDAVAQWLARREAERA